MTKCSVPEENIKKLTIVNHTLQNIRRMWSFHVVVLQKMAKKCIKILTTHAELLFFSLNTCLATFLLAKAPLSHWLKQTFNLAEISHENKLLR